RDDQRPDVAPLQQLAPRDRRRVVRVAARRTEELALLRRDARMLVRRPVEREPRREPDEAEEPGRDEGRLPAEAMRDPRDERRGDDRAGRAADVPDAGR